VSVFSNQRFSPYLEVGVVALDLFQILQILLSLDHDLVLDLLYGNIVLHLVDKPCEFVSSLLQILLRSALPLRQVFLCPTPGLQIFLIERGGGVGRESDAVLLFVLAQFVLLEELLCNCSKGDMNLLCFVAWSKITLALVSLILNSCSFPSRSVD